MEEVTCKTVVEEIKVPIEEKSLIQSVLSTALAVTKIQDALEREFKTKDLDFDVFYETHFKQANLIDKVLDMYTEMYSSIAEADWPKITGEIQKETTAGNEYENDAIQALQTTEKNWDHLMKEIDDCMKALWRATETDYVDVIDIGHVKITDCESSKSVALHDVLSGRYGRYTLFVLIRYYGCPVCFAHVRDLVDRAKEFEMKCANIIIVCKGSKEGGSKWKQLTGVTFPVLADEKSEFVRSLHFGASVWDLCNMPVFHWRAKVRAAGDTEYRGYVEDKLHDFYQLGGDIIVDSKGRLISVYKSKATTDRPPVDYLLDLIPSNDHNAPRNSISEPRRSVVSGHRVNVDHLNVNVTRPRTRTRISKCGCTNREGKCCCTLM